MPQSPQSSFRPDYRRADGLGVASGLRQRDPLALAEAYHRTVPAAYACARRLLGASDDVEALLRTVYAELWASPPDGGGLEGWVRARCFELGAEDLRNRGTGPTSPSAAGLLPELPAPADSYLDAAERGLAELDPEQRDAVLRAHDQGVPSAEQPADDASAALRSGLIALAGQSPQLVQGDGCDDLPDLADWVLGLLAPDRAAQVEAAVAAVPGCAGMVQMLRAGRRRVEGLPITPDMSLRVLAVVLTDDAGGGLGRPSNQTDHLLAHVAATAPAPDSDSNPLPSALDQPASEELLASTAAPAAGPVVATAADLPTANTAVESSAPVSADVDAPASDSAAQVAPAAAGRSAGAPSEAAPPEAAPHEAAPSETAPPRAAADETSSTAATPATSKPLPASLRQELDGAAPDQQAMPGVPGDGGTSASGETAAAGGTARTAGGSVPAGERTKDEATATTGHEPPGGGRRIAVIVLAVLFLVAGVALGLYLGLEGGL